MRFWGIGAAQIFAALSPAMHEEFALKHEARWYERFGYNFYGCCEPLHHKVDIIRKNIPILRGLTLRNSSTSFIINGHTPSPARWANLSNVIYSFFGEQDPFEVHDYFDRLPTPPDLIVITTRTSDWVRSGEVNSTFCAPSEKLTPFPGIEKFSFPFFTLVKSWETVKIYKLNETKALLVWIDISFSEGSWYLDGAYKDYSSTTDSGILKITVRAESAKNAWTGLTKQLPNCSGATYVKIRYRIDVPAYVLEIVLWRLEQPWTIRYLKQSQEWYEELSL